MSKECLVGKRRQTFTLVDTNPTSIKNMLLGLEMVDQVDQSFAKVHFHRMTIEYSNCLVNKIVDKEAEMVAIKSSFLKITRKDTMKITMNSKERTRMMKYLAQKKLVINKKRKV